MLKNKSRNCHLRTNFTSFSLWATQIPYSRRNCMKSWSNFCEASDKRDIFYLKRQGMFNYMKTVYIKKCLANIYRISLSSAYSTNQSTESLLPILRHFKRCYFYSKPNLKFPDASILSNVRAGPISLIIYTLPPPIPPL